MEERTTRRRRERRQNYRSTVAFMTSNLSICCSRVRFRLLSVAGLHYNRTVSVFTNLVNYDLLRYGFFLLHITCAQIDGVPLVVYCIEPFS